MRFLGLFLCASSVQSFAPPTLRSVVRSSPGVQGCRSTLGSSTAIRAKENGGGGSSELTREGKLIVSILIDLIGMSTYLLPVAGEGADVGWAPVSAALIFWLYAFGTTIGGLYFVPPVQLKRYPLAAGITIATCRGFLLNFGVPKSAMAQSRASEGLCGVPSL